MNLLGCIRSIVLPNRVVFVIIEICCTTVGLKQAICAVGRLTGVCVVFRDSTGGNELAAELFGSGGQNC